MKILFYTDVHFRSSGDFFKISKNGHSNLLNHLSDSLLWLENQIETHKPDLVVCGGDLYHSLDYIDRNTVTISFSKLKHLCEVCSSVGAEHKVLLGNHDFISLKREISVIDFLDDFKNTSVVRSLEQIGNIVFCPYFDSKEEFCIPEEILSNSKNSLFFGHLSLQGGFYKSFKKNTQIIKEYEQENLTAQVKSFKLVFNGHHHIPQKINSNIILPGSFLQLSLDEPSLDMPRGIWLIDSETFSTQLIENKISPRLHRIYSKEDLEKVEDNSYVYFSYSDSEELSSSSLELKRFLGLRTEKVVKIKKEKSKELLNFSSLTNTQLFEHYLNNIEVKSPIELLSNFGKGCLNEASSINN